MKLALLTIALFTLGSQAFACYGSNDNRLCTGDRVIPDAYSRGYATVKAVNSYSRKYTVKGNNSPNYHRYSRQKISFTKGCLEGVCVGDKVFPDAYSRGYAIVKAINPATRKFTVKGNNSPNYHRYDFDELALIEECLDYNSSERYSYNFN